MIRPAPVSTVSKSPLGATSRARGRLKAKFQRNDITLDDMKGRFLRLFDAVEAQNFERDQNFAARDFGRTRSPDEGAET